MESFIRYLEERIKEAEASLKDLDTLIKLGAEVGMDVSQYKIRYDRLKADIERWKEALKKVTKKGS